MKRATIPRVGLCWVMGALLLQATGSRAENVPTPPAPSSSNQTEQAAVPQQVAQRIEQQMSQTLLRAYQREFVVLETEKRALKERLEKMRADSETRLLRAKSEHTKYETALMATTLLADQKERQLERREIDSEQTDQVSDVISTIEAQSAEVLRQSLVLPSEPNAGTTDPGQEERLEESTSPLPKRLERALGGAIEKLQKSADVFVLSVPFYDADGKKIEGKVQRIGEIAAFGVTADGYQALSPAGGGALKVWPAGRPQKLSESGLPQQAVPLQLFLTDNWSQPVEQRKEKSPLQIVQDGGTIAWVIVGLGIFALLLSCVRTVNLYWVGRGLQVQGDSVEHAIKAKDFPLAEHICDNTRAISELLRVVLRSRDMPRDMQHDLMDEQILRIFARIDRFGQMILVAAAVAPLLGLLGTVTGMISTFDAITEFGTGDPRVLAGGISEALITTELGLIVAIPSLLLGNLLSGQADRLKNLFEAKGLQAANLCREIDETVKPRVLHGEPAWTRVS